MEIRKYSLNQTPISSLLERYKNVKVRKAVTLFPATYNWDLILKELCPACGRKLKLLQRRPLYVCGRKTCPASIDRDPFKVSAQKLAEILAKNAYLKR